MIKTQHCPNCEATEQKLHDFQQEVSDALFAFYGSYHNASGGPLERFIIPKSDPLAEVIRELEDGTWGETKAEYADRFRAALEARGLTITTVEKD